MELHESIKHTLKEVIVKTQPGFRLRLRKHEVIAPKGLFSLDMIQESLKEDGTVFDHQTYSFFLDKDELQALANGLTA